MSIKAPSYNLHTEILTQINFAGNFAGKDFFFGTLEHDGAGVYDDGAVGNFKGIADVMVGNKDTDSAGSKEFYYTFDVGYGDWVNSGKRFVQKQEFWFNGKGTGNLCTAAFTTRKCVGLLVTDAAN